MKERALAIAGTFLTNPVEFDGEGFREYGNTYSIEETKTHRITVHHSKCKTFAYVMINWADGSVELYSFKDVVDIEELR